MLLDYYLLENIVNFNDISELTRYILINKSFFKRYSKFIKAIIKIQKFYRRYPIECSFNDELISKKDLVRIYITKYPMKYLTIYPEFLINKIQKPDLLNWLVNNTPKSIDKRTRRHIRNFLLHPDVSKEDILYTGW